VYVEQVRKRRRVTQRGIAGYKLQYGQIGNVRDERLTSGVEAVMKMKILW